jgi:hypothetical protein
MLPKLKADRHHVLVHSSPLCDTTQGLSYMSLFQWPSASVHLHDRWVIFEIGVEPHTVATLLQTHTNVCNASCGEPRSCGRHCNNVFYALQHSMHSLGDCTNSQRAHS